MYWLVLDSASRGCVTSDMTMPVPWISGSVAKSREDCGSSSAHVKVEPPLPWARACTEADTLAAGARANVANKPEAEATARAGDPGDAPFPGAGGR